MDLVKNVGSLAVAVAVIDATGLSNALPVPDSELGQFAKSGALYLGADEVVDYILDGSNDIVRQNFWSLGDRFIFFTGVKALVSKSGFGEKATEIVDGISPFSQQMNDYIVSGSVVAGSRGLIETLSQRYQGTFIDYIKSPTSLIRF